MGELFSREGDRNLAVKFFSKGCEYASKESGDLLFNCYIAGQYLAEFFNAKLSINYFKKVCDLKERQDQNKDLIMEACARLGVYAKKEKILLSAIQYSKNKCEKFKSNKSEQLSCYNLACVYSLLGENGKALKYLFLALQKGYRNWDSIINDFETRNIQFLEEYKNLVKKFQK